MRNEVGDSLIEISNGILKLKLQWMCAIWSILRAEERQSTALVSHKRLVMLTVRFCHNKQVWRPTTAQGLNSPMREPADAQLVVFSQRNPQRLRVHLIHNTTQHCYFKKTSCQWLAPLRLGPSILGRDLFYEYLFFFHSSHRRSVGHGLLRRELCLFSSASLMCCTGQRETLTGIFQRVTSVWLAGCHQGNVRPVSTVYKRAAVARLIGADGLLFWECQIQSDSLGSKWQGRRKTKSGKRQVLSAGKALECTNAWRDRTWWRAITEGWLSRCGITAVPRTAISTESMPLMSISWTSQQTSGHQLQKAISRTERSYKEWLSAEVAKWKRTVSFCQEPLLIRRISVRMTLHYAEDTVCVWVVCVWSKSLRYGDKMSPQVWQYQKSLTLGHVLVHMRKNKS